MNPGDGASIYRIFGSDRSSVNYLARETVPNLGNCLFAYHVRKCIFSFLSRDRRCGQERWKYIFLLSHTPCDKKTPLTCTVTEIRGIASTGPRIKFAVSFLQFSANNNREILNYTSAFIRRNKFRSWEREREKIFPFASGSVIFTGSLSKLSISRIKAERSRRWKFSGDLISVTISRRNIRVFVPWDIAASKTHTRKRTRFSRYGWLTLALTASIGINARFKRMTSLLFVIYLGH